MTDKTNPIPAETAAMAEWLFSNIEWTKKVEPPEDAAAFSIERNEMEMA